MSLRPYQQQCLNAIAQNYDVGVTRQLISAATGTGKTVVLSHIPELMQGRLDGQMLVLVHTDELIDQNIGKLRKYNPTLRVSKEKASEYADPNAAIVVASVATLGRKGTARGRRFNWSRFDKVITDEAHHSCAQSYKNIYEMVDVLRHDTHKLHVGCTATPFRNDAEDLTEIFDRVTFEYGIRQAIEDNWLCDVRGLRLSTNTRLDGVHRLAGDFKTDELSDAVNTPERNAGIVKGWLQHATERPTIVFAVDIEHARDLAAEFQRHGVRAEAIWGDDPERRGKLGRFLRRGTDILCNCALLTEGFDAPLTSCIVMARPTQSRGLYVQCVGRGTRTDDGKDDLLVIDVCDLSSRFTLNVSQMFGLPTGLDLMGGSAIKHAKRVEELTEAHPEKDFTDALSLDQVEVMALAVDLFQALPELPLEAVSANLNWIAVPDGYVLWLPERRALRIKKNMLDHFEMIAEGAKFAETETVEEAFTVAEEWVKQHQGGAMGMLLRDAKWNDDPATEKQRELLRKLYHRDVPSSMTKGHASKLIGSVFGRRERTTK